MKVESNQAALNAKDVTISTKMSVELCGYIKNKKLKDAQKFLDRLVNMKSALPIKRFRRDLSHKKGMGAGRYPIKVGKEFLNLLNSVQKNAENKGLNTDNLIISYAKADRAEARHRSTRKGRTRMKNTHVSLVVTESNNGENKK